MKATEETEEVKELLEIKENVCSTLREEKFRNEREIQEKTIE